MLVVCFAQEQFDTIDFVVVVFFLIMLNGNKEDCKICFKFNIRALALMTQIQGEHHHASFFIQQFEKVSSTKSHKVLLVFPLSKG